MDFQTNLNNLMDIIGCNAKELSKTSGISTSVISRYRSGERTPKQNSIQLNKLIDGLIILANNNNIKKINKKEIKERLTSSLYEEIIDFNIFKDNLNNIINILNINVSEMAKYIGFDSSYISKIRNGKRQPQNIHDFSFAISKYIVYKYNDDKSIAIINKLVNNNIYEDNYLEIIHNWICNNSDKPEFDSF